MNEWTPAVIASHEHIARFHSVEPGEVSQHAGKKIRVRENQDARTAMDAVRKSVLGCPGYSIEVHPDDARLLWPERDNDNYNCTICTCSVLMD